MSSSVTPAGVDRRLRSAQWLPNLGMLTLRFSSIMTATLIVGPADAYLLIGNMLVEHPSGRLVAALTGHQWKVRDRHFFRIDCESPGASTLRFVGSATREGIPLGPYRRSHAADGMLYGDATPVARYVDESDRWVSTHDGQAWPVVAVEPHGGNGTF